MKTKLSLFFLLISLQLFAAKYYISQNGKDTNKGTITEPFKTLRKATVTANYTDTIILLPGTHTASLCAFKEGVFLIGSGADKTILNIPFFKGDLLQFGSQSISTIPQTISGITFEGNGIARACMVFTNRSNITIKDCVFQNFKENVVDFYNKEQIPIVGNQLITRNKFINCSGYIYPGSPGALWIRGNKDIEISFNVFEATFRPGDSAGFCLKASFTSVIHSFGNRYSVPKHNDDLRSAFAIELNNNLGNSTFVSDTIQGVFDIAGRMTTKGNYDTAVSIHDCVFGPDELQAVNRYGIYIEANVSASDIHIFRNHFRNLENVLRLTPLNDNTLSNISFTFNYCTDIGTKGKNGAGYAVRGGTYYYPSAKMDNIKIDNNYFKAAEPNNQVTAFQIPSGITATNISFCNNISIGFENASILTVGNQKKGTVSNFTYSGNISDSQPKFYGIIPKGFINTNNLLLDKNSLITQFLKL